jgi:predicted transcriptional regulator of viral defense system
MSTSQIAPIADSLTSATAPIALSRWQLAERWCVQVDAPPSTPDQARAELDALIEALEQVGVLRSIPGVALAWTTPRGRAPNPLAWLSALDPLGHAGHLSALSWHGLTPLIARTLHWSTLPDPIWRKEMGARLERQLGDRLPLWRTLRLPWPTRPAVSRVGAMPVDTWQTSELGAAVLDADGICRVSRIGRTFLDTLREPGRCGGMSHVVEIWSEHAARHVTRIIAEVERHGRAVDKVRAGFLLESSLGSLPPAAEAWRSLVRRGGDRKLDPHAPFDGSRTSEGWCLSLNMP